MTRTRREVVDAARYYERTGYYWNVGMCLKFSRTCAGAPGGVYDANAAWANAKYRHTSGVAPAGTFVHWSGGAHGHVAVSVGNGACISTDVLRQGRVDEVPISRITLGWNYPLRGWSEDINGVRPLDEEDDMPWTGEELRDALRPMVKDALEAALTADNPALLNAVRVAIEAERGEDARAVLDTLGDDLAADTEVRKLFRSNVRVPVDAELTQRKLGT